MDPGILDASTNPDGGVYATRAARSQASGAEARKPTRDDSRSQCVTTAVRAQQAESGMSVNVILRG